MAKYTTEVRAICETLAGKTEEQSGSQVNTVIASAMDSIFDEYPIFDEDYRDVLNAKILKHYYTREIGFETFGLWKVKLNTRMEEMMPYFNKLYNSELINFNPLEDIDLETQRSVARGETSSSEGTSEVSGSTSGSNRNKENNASAQTDAKKNVDKYSETPQNGLSGVENGNYLTTARIVNDSNDTSLVGNRESVGESNSNNVQNSKNNESGNVNTTEDYLMKVSGKLGNGKSYNQLLKEYRDNFLNIDMQVIESLSDLFFSLWD